MSDTIGHKHTEESKKKMSESAMGKPGTNTGKTFDAGWRKNIGDANRGKKRSPETLQKMSEGHAGQKPVNAKLTFEIAEQIRTEHIKNGISQKKISIKYGIAQSSVSDIITGKKYKSKD